MTITPKQIEDTFIKMNSMKDIIRKLKEQGVFDQQLSMPCLQVIADNFGLVNHEDRVLIWQAIHSGEEAHHNVTKFWFLQSNNSVRDMMVHTFSCLNRTTLETQ